MTTKWFHVFGEPVKAHSKECAAGFRCDRQHSIIYPAMQLHTGDVVSWTMASRILKGFCVYCGPFFNSIDGIDRKEAN